MRTVAEFFISSPLLLLGEGASYSAGQAGARRGDRRRHPRLRHFNLINRVADALGFELAGPASVSRYAGFLLQRGYLPPF
jgi:hypothetical protein